MELKVKKLHPDAVLPFYSRGGDAAMDLTAVSCTYNEEFGYWEYDTGLAFAIPEGYVGLIFPRSSLSNKNQLLTNHVGVVDSNFRGSVKFRFKCVEKSTLKAIYKVGERLGQLMIIPIPFVNIQVVDQLDNTSRGSEGFGSSGQ